MSSKMLIDASHPEETRVVVTKGNKIEDFDFESEHKKQIRGNIYLAKVTRVEPSLQACFVEYGGNRHGFLPFSEIHPDYYQIPVADREALMRDMARELAAEDGDDEGDADESVSEARSDDGEEGERKSRRRSRRGGRRRRGEARADGEADGDADEVSGAGADDDDDADDEPDAFADEDDDAVSMAVEGESVSDEPSEPAGDDDKPTRRTSRRRKAPVAAADGTSGDAAEMASEPAVEATGDADATGEEAPKLKRRASRRKKAPVEAVASDASDDAANDAANDAASEPLAEADAADEGAPKPKRRASRRKKAPVEADAVEADDAADGGTATSSDDTAEDEPKRRPSRRRKAPVVADAPTGKADAGDGTDDRPVGAKMADAVADAVTDALSLNEAEGSADAAAGDADAAGGGSAKVDAKPARKRTRRRKAPIQAEADADEAPEEADEDASEGGAVDVPVEARKPSREGRNEGRGGRGRGRSRSPADDEADEDDTGEDALEETGADDALDEAEDEVAPRRRRAPRKHYKIQEVIKRRQILLVQVTKEERGNKGAALTTYLSLAGRYSVLMPNTARGGGISRKIAQASDRKRLKEIARGLDVPDGMGVILRTAAAARTKPEVNRDFEYLMRLWDSVRELTLQSSAPALVYEEGDLIKRSIRDLYNKDISEIVVAGEEGYREARDFMRMLMPSQERDVKQWQRATPMLAAHGVEAELDRMMQPQVNLKSGGYIIINQTEALVAIDVNSGRSTREHSIEQTARNTNLEAAEEVARQLKLRDLAGLIVIDFIDMDEKRNNRAVEARLKDCLKHDRARIQLGRISSFGLLEMSRQRMRSSVLESTMQECPHCHGTGYLRSVSSVALAILRAVEEQMRKHSDHAAVVRTDASTALSLLNTKRAHIAALEEEHGVPLVVEADGTMAHQSFKVERGAFVERTQRIERQVRQDHTLMDVVDAGADEAADDERDIEVAADNFPIQARTGDAPDDEREDNGKRRRRGRRGGRRRSDERDDAASEGGAIARDEPSSPGEIVVEAVGDGSADGVANAKAADASGGDAGTPDDDGAEVTTRPRRRRSTRRAAPLDEATGAPESARGNAGADDAGASQGSASQGSAITGSGSEAAAIADDATRGEAAGEEASRRRSTRRRKAPMAPTAPQANAADASVSRDGSAAPVAIYDAPTADGGGDGEDADGSARTRRSTRRSTRRAPAPLASSPAAPAPVAAAPVAADATNGADPVPAARNGHDGVVIDDGDTAVAEPNGAPEGASVASVGAVDPLAADNPSDAAARSGDATGIAESDDAATEGEGEGKPRRGWWNRGFF